MHGTEFKIIWFSSSLGWKLPLYGDNFYGWGNLELLIQQPVDGAVDFISRSFSFFDFGEQN